MLKKIFSLILILSVLLSAAACGVQDKKPAPTSDGDVTTASSAPDASQIVEQTFESRCEYMTFDECINAATNVVLAEFTGKIIEKGIYKDLIFSPAESLKGASLEEDIVVRILPQDVIAIQDGEPVSSYSIDYKRYERGVKYILVLEKRISVYNPYDIYLPVANIIISENGERDMYATDLLSEHSPTLKEADLVNFNSIKAAVRSLAEASPQPEAPKDYIRSDELSEIVDKSPCVFIVRPIEYEGESDNNDTVRYFCRIEEELKGKFELIDDILEPMIIFPKNTVELDKEYVALMERPGTYYIISSKNSVYPADSEQAELIKALLLGDDDSLIVD